MQAVAMTRELVMAPEAMGATIDVALWVRRAARVTFLVAGIAATLWIMGQFGTLLVYGLPAPLIRRMVVPADGPTEAGTAA